MWWWSLMSWVINSLALKGKRMILCHLWAIVSSSKLKGNHGIETWKLGWLSVFGRKIVGRCCCFFGHKYTIRKWNTLDKERVEGRQIKLEQTEYCIMMLHPTSGAENTEVLFVDCPAIMAHRTARLQDTERSNSTTAIHWFKWITAIVFALTLHWRVYLFLPVSKRKFICREIVEGIFRSHIYKQNQQYCHVQILNCVIYLPNKTHKQN